MLFVPVQSIIKQVINHIYHFLSPKLWLFKFVIFDFFFPWLMLYVSHLYDIHFSLLALKEGKQPKFAIRL